MSHSIRLFLISVIALSATSFSFAMQLGASKGSAVFGRPLDLTVPVRFDAPIEDPFNCFSAEIFQADTKFDAGRVRVDVTPASNGLDASVRIRSITAVVEPWAKVILRNNCGAKVTRQYDFLTDFAADMPPSNPQAELVATNNLPTANSVSNSPDKRNTQTTAVSNSLPLLPASSAPVTNWTVERAQASGQTTKQTSVQQVPSKPPRTFKPKAVEAKPTVTAAAPANPLGKSANLAQSRLKMETFELTDEHQVLLKLSTAMIAPTGMRTPEEIQALAQATAVWRAINGMPAAATAAQPAPVNNTAVATVQTKPTSTTKDEKNGFSDPVVYGLMGLLALTLACIAWLGLRIRRASQLGYGWLNKTAQITIPESTEPPQFMPTKFTDTAFVPEEQAKEQAKEQVDELAEGATTEFETPRHPQVEAAFEDSPLAALQSNKEAEALQRHETTLKINSKDQASEEFSAANSPERSPEHFDDSRFDERHLNALNVARRPVHDRPITSPTELMDLVLDSPPKLRSVPSPEPVVDMEIFNEPLPETKAPHQKTNDSATKTPPTAKTEIMETKSAETKTSSKTESKGNLIDFEIFAEPAPIVKPSRFAR